VVRVQLATSVLGRLISNWSTVTNTNFAHVLLGKFTTKKSVNATIAVLGFIAQDSTQKISQALILEILFIT